MQKTQQASGGIVSSLLDYFLVPGLPPPPPAPPVPNGAPGSPQYDLVQAQNRVLADEDLEPERTGEQRTFCNIATCKVAQDLGAPMEALMGKDPYLANTIAGNLSTSQDWQVVTPQQGQEFANRGILVIATQTNPSGPGHVAAVRPTNVYNEAPPPGSGPVVANIGKSNGIYRATGVFNGNRSIIYYSPNQ